LSNQVVLVNGNIGLVCRLPDGRLFSVIGFTIAGGKVVEMDILADPERLSGSICRRSSDEPLTLVTLPPVVPSS
jgi:hypothetical protein